MCARASVRVSVRDCSGAAGAAVKTEELYGGDDDFDNDSDASHPGVQKQSKSNAGKKVVSSLAHLRDAAHARHACTPSNRTHTHTHTHTHVAPRL
jgi:hypothetical protein